MVIRHCIDQLVATNKHQNTAMMKTFSKEFKAGILLAFYEYLLIITPVLIYISLEAIHKRNWDLFYQSPEWSIATIFLSFIALNRYKNTLIGLSVNVSDSILGIFEISGLIVVICATLNAYISIENDTGFTMIFRIILFIISSLKFFILIAGTKIIKTKD